jgi:cobalamin biosynthesis Mg chelatase CobN
MSDTELEEMEGRERSSVEARIRCLRNIQVLLDAAVMEMQQYSAVVARANATAATTASSTAPPAPASASPAAPADSTSDATPVGNEASAATSASATSASSTSSVPKLSTAASAASTISSSTPAAVLPEVARPPSETGARPKVVTEVSSSSALKIEPPAEEKVELKGEKSKENPFEALCEAEAVKTAEQEEIRKRRLAVFEEQKKRLMNK